MSAITQVAFSSICTLPVLKAGLALLNKTKNTNMTLHHHVDPQAITGWVGQKTNNKVSYEIKGTGTAGTIGIIILNHEDEEIAPDAEGNFVGKTNLIGYHIYIDQALGRNGSHLRAACDTARHIMIAEQENLVVSEVTYVPAKNEYLVAVEVG